MTMTQQINDVADAIARYVVSTCAPQHSIETLPREDSLVELGIMDSYAVIELVGFIEQTWNIRIEDDELTKEKMGSVHKMARLIISKRVG